MPDNVDHWLPNTRNRLAQRRARKPDTKAGQFWALWPEIKAALDGGQSVKTIQRWLQEDADLILTLSTLTSYISRSRQKECARRKAEAAEAFLRVHSRQTAVYPEPDNHPFTVSRDAPPAINGDSSVPERANDPMERAMQALRKRRLDIREIHGDGDPSNHKLI